ncbi:Uncharacterised protein [Mycoplasmopsis synoviae]|uniref:Uncharacterized protein n=1 Tax=Mycoplasmopsis synoviae TaxID=2109 RepID=A0A3B0PS48_MYCSY|nr:Uncharacterised protein [Mycoplasmopsis synoviae]
MISLASANERVLAVFLSVAIFKLIPPVNSMFLFSPAQISLLAPEIEAKTISEITINDSDAKTNHLAFL